MGIKIVPIERDIAQGTGGATNIKKSNKKGSGKTVSDADVKQIMKEFNLNNKDAEALLKV